MASPTDQPQQQPPTTSQWGWGNVWQNARSAAEELSKKVANHAPQLQETADYMMQNWGLARQQLSQKASVGLSLFSTKLDYTYITPRILAMPFPSDPANNKKVEGGNPINAIATFLDSNHHGHYMIWNVSEESYNYSLFHDQVLEYKFPGHPAPPLGLLFKICTSIESWLDADDQNVAVVHCLTGKGRTASILACLLTWSGNFSSALEALQYIAQCRQTPINVLTIPSQRRYIQYFSNMMDGVKPNPQPLLLRRIIIGPVPKFGAKGGGGGALNRAGNGADDIGCRPYIQLFKAGKLITTAPWQGMRNTSQSTEKSGAEVSWASHTADQIAFHVDCIIHGDILLRCRHLDTSGKRISMFRIAFHTGYAPGGVYRLSKEQLDGACSDPRFDDDFFIDLIFAPVEKGSESPKASQEASSDQTAASALVAQAADATDNGVTVEPSGHSAFDALLHRNNRFWEAVATKKARNRAKKPEAKSRNAHANNFSIADGVDVEEEVSFGESTPQLTEEGDIGLSSDELLKQLTLAEQEMDEGIASRYVTPTEEFELRPADDDHITPVSNSKGQSNPETKMEETSAQSELSALEALEKELGLAGLGLDPQPVKPAESTSAEQEDENLEELEKYLQSLQNS